MPNLTTIPDYDEIAAFIKERVDAMRSPVQQWTDLARLAIQNLPHDAQKLALLEAHINALRAELRVVVQSAAEHFTEEQLHALRKHVGMSKYAWRTIQRNREVNIRTGFSLVIF